MNTLFEEMVKERAVPAVFKKVCNEIVMQYGHYLQREYGISMDQLMPEQGVIIDHLTSMEDYHVYLKNLFQNVHYSLQEKKISPKQKLIQEVKSYLKDHFDQPVQLSNISAEFHLNASYLSSTFSKEEGVTISDYLLRLRINKAKELLRQTNLK